MPRPNRPGYFAARKCWRFKLDGKQKYICKGIPPDERPQRDGIPRRVWDEMDRIIREAEDRAAAGSDPSLFWLTQAFLSWTEEQVDAGELVRSKLDNRKSHVSLILELFPGRAEPARAITPERADEFFRRLRAQILPRTKRPPAPYYVHEVGRTVCQMLRWACKLVRGREPARLLAANPLADYKFPPQPGAVRGYVPGEVVRRFLRWAWARARWAEVPRPVDPATGKPTLKPQGPAVGFLKRRFHRIYVLMLRFGRLTGCRPGEACGLRWSEISPPPPPAPEDGRPRRRWEPTRIEVDEVRRKTRKQTDRRRVIYLTEPAARILRTIERLPGRHPEFVFTHMRGTHAEGRGHGDPLAGEPYPHGSAASQTLTNWKKAARAEGLEGAETVGPNRIIAYANRHAFASEGAALGFSDEQIAEQLGNTPEVMRKVYAHTVEDKAAETAKRLAELRREIARTRRAKERGTDQPAAGDDKEAG